MPKNVIKTRKGNFGKRDALLAKPVIRTEKNPPVVNLDSEIGNRGSSSLPKIKRVNT